jgi:hypothetical protein
VVWTLESKSVGRAAAAQGGAHGIPIFTSLSLPDPRAEASRLVPFACRGALVRGQQGKLPLGFVSYGVVDGNLRESEGRRAWAGWSLREATRRERGACLALVVLVLVGCPPARYRPRRQGIGQILALGAPPRYDSLIPLRRLDDEVCCHGRSRRCALRRACGGAHGSGGRRRRRRGSGGEREG